MKVVTGIVSHIRSTVEISGNKHGIDTSQVLGFRIGKQSIQLAMPSLPQIADGDEVVVAGEIENGVLYARAYRNFDNNAHGQWRNNWLIMCVLTATIFLPLCWVFLLAPSANGIWIYPAMWLPIPCYAVSRSVSAMKTAAASRLIWSVDR